MFEAVKKLFNRIFRGWKYRTLGDIEDEIRYLGKKELVKRIVTIAGQLNGNPGVIDSIYEAELRRNGKRKLVKALMILHVSYTKKLQGVKYART